MKMQLASPSSTAMWLLLLCISLLPPSTHTQSGTAPQEDSLHTLHILSLLPYPDPEGQQPSWDEGYTLLITEQMAIDRLNQDPDILPGYRLLLTRSDSGCDIRSKATLSFVNDTLTNPSPGPVVGLVGPGCSVSASTVGGLTGRQQIALINVHIAGSLLLADRENYPYSYGTLDSTEVFVKTLLQLIQDRGWKHVSALYDESRLYYYSTIQVMERKIRTMNAMNDSNLDYFSSAVYETNIPLDTLIKNNYRVVLLFVGPDFLSKILCLAFQHNMLYPVYQFIIVSRVASEINSVSFTYDQKPVECSEADINTVIHNSLVIHYQLRPFDVSQKTDSGYSYEEFERVYNEKIASFEVPEQHARYNITVQQSFWAPSFFDAVWSLGLALHNSMTLVNLTEYKLGNPNQSMIIRQQLEELTFEGVSGTIQFCNRTGYAQRNVAIYQIKSRTNMDYIGYYDTFNKSITLNVGGFIDGEFENVTVIDTAPKFLAPPILLLTAISLLLVVLLQVLTIRYRHFKSVKASSPKLSQLAFIGCYMQVLGSVINVVVDVYTETISPRTNCILWHVLNIAPAIGTTLIFGTVCTRTWRLYRIFVHFKDPGKFMSEKVLVSCVALFVFLDVILIIVWIRVDPFTPCRVTHRVEYEEVRDASSLVVNMRRVNRMIYTCDQKYFWVWCVGLVFCNMLLMGGTVVLALLTRHIPYKDFKTRGIMGLSYILTAVLGLGFAIYSILLINQTFSAIIFRFLVLSIMFNMYCYLSCFLLFLPPLYPLLQLKLSNMRKRKEGRRRRGSSTTTLTLGSSTKTLTLTKTL